MNRRLLILLLLILTGCGGAPGSTLSDRQIIERWAKALEVGNIEDAKSMMIEGSQHWQESAQTALKKASWKNHKILDLPANEKRYAPPGTRRVQWELQVAETERYKLLCTDVREKEGKVEALNGTQYCNSSGSFESMLDPLLFEESDLPGAKLNAYGEYRTDKAIARGMPKPLASGSINAKRSPDEPLPTYFVHMHMFDPATADRAFTWWHGQAPNPRADVLGIGERAFSVEEHVAMGTSRSVTFTRCNAVVQVNAFIPVNGLAIDFSGVKSAAGRVDQRLKKAICGKQ
jgi:hypothetical protein